MADPPGLSDFPIFYGLSADELHGLETQCQREQYKQGDEILSRESTSTEVYFHD